jgi:hypothetical protein
MAPESFSLRCANLAKHSYQSPSQCIGTLAAIVPIELLQLCGAVPSSGVRTRTRVNRFTKPRNVWCLTQLILVHLWGLTPCSNTTVTNRFGLSSDVQRAIGQRLRQHYAIERTLPARLADLLKEFEQRSNKPETVARGHYVSAA